MWDEAYRLGVLLLVFGGVLLLGREFFGGSSDTAGLLGVFTLALGLLTGVTGVASVPE